MNGKWHNTFKINQNPIIINLQLFKKQNLAVNTLKFTYIVVYTHVYLTFI